MSGRADRCVLERVDEPVDMQGSGVMLGSGGSEQGHPLGPGGWEGEVGFLASLVIQDASGAACHFIQEDKDTFRVHLCYSELSFLPCPLLCGIYLMLGQ